jgi:ATP-binding cassette subfamily B protein
VVLIDEGRVVAEGTHDELLAGHERYRQVLAAAALDGEAVAEAEAALEREAEAQRQSGEREGSSNVG